MGLGSWSYTFAKDYYRENSAGVLSIWQGRKQKRVCLSVNSIPREGRHFFYTCLIKRSMVIKVTFIEANCEWTLHTIRFYSISLKLPTSFSFGEFKHLANTLFLQQLGEVRAGTVPTILKGERRHREIRKLPKDTERTSGTALTDLQISASSFRALSQSSKATSS